MKKMDEACVSCGGIAHLLLYNAEDHYSSKKFALLQCRQCGLTTTYPRLSNDELIEYYPTPYYGENGFRFHPIFEYIVQYFRKNLANRISNHYPDGERILDIGSGRGTLLAEMGVLGWETFGTEYSRILAEAVENKYGIHIYPTPKLQDCNFPDQHFDVIVCYHVLEHLNDPMGTLIEIERILQPSGLLIIAVPNIDGTVARFCREHWFANDVPRHLFHFSPETLTFMLEKAGFQVVYQSTLSLEQDVFGFAQSTLNLLGFPYNIFYDFIRSSTAKLRYQQNNGNKLNQLISDTTTFIFGTILSIVGIPVSIITAATGKGGTIEFWTNPHITDDY